LETLDDNFKLNIYNILLDFLFGKV